MSHKGKTVRIALAAGLGLLLAVTLTAARRSSARIDAPNTDLAVDVAGTSTSTDSKLIHYETVGAAEVREDRYPSGHLKSRTGIVRDATGIELFHSKSQEWYESGRIKLQGEWKHGSRVSGWEAWHENGKPWVRGAFDAQGPAGIWTYWDEHGEVCGQRRQGVKFDHWRECCESLDLCGQGEYVNGRMHGPWKFTTLKGEAVLDIEFDDGAVHGRVVLHKFGRMEFVFDNGRDLPDERLLITRDGKYTAQDKAYREVLARMSLPDLASFRWLPVDGPFDPPYLETTEARWPDGSLKQRVEFQVLLEGSQVVRVQHGKATSWYSSARLHEEQEFRDGLEHGNFACWYPDQRRRWQIEYRWGKPLGRWRFWHPNGRKQAEVLLGRNGTGNWQFWNADGSSAQMADPDAWLRNQLQGAAPESTAAPAR